MLEPISYRGDRSDTVTAPGVGLAYRFWNGRPSKSPAIFKGLAGELVAAAGTLAPPVDFPAAHFNERLKKNELADLDGAFAVARWEPATSTLTLLRDPFGVRSLYYLEHQETFYFATELKQLLAIPSLPIELDEAAVHWGTVLCTGVGSLTGESHFQSDFATYLRRELNVDSTRWQSLCT